MKYEELCSHIKAKRQVRIAGNSVVQFRNTVGLPLRIFSKLKCGRVRRYVEVECKTTGKVSRVDICRIRSLTDMTGLM